MLDFRIRLQLAEALGPENRWFCAQKYGRQIDDPELLLAHYIRSGGAADFDRRYRQAMGNQNRWFCSEFYRREINDPRLLWEYYTTHAVRSRSGASNVLAPVPC